MSAERTTPAVHVQRSGWGNSITWFDYDRLRITGHLTPLPEPGDEFHTPMQSGRTGVWEIIAVEPCWDPHDQFFGTVEWKGYA